MDKRKTHEIVFKKYGEQRRLIETVQRKKLKLYGHILQYDTMHGTCLKAKFLIKRVRQDLKVCQN